MVDPNSMARRSDRALLASLPEPQGVSALPGDDPSRRWFGLKYSAIYRRLGDQIRADWIAYDSLDAAMLGPEQNPYLGERLGYVIRPFCGPPVLVGLPLTAPVDLART